MRESLQIQVLTDATRFLDAAQTMLERDEVTNALVLGTCLRMRQHPERVKREPFLCLVRDGDRPVAAAMITPPFKLVLSCAEPDPAPCLAVIAGVLSERGWRMPGVLGPAPLSRAFARLWAGLTGVTARPGMHERAFELRRVNPPRVAGGRPRHATLEDVGLMAAWFAAFAEEAGVERLSLAEAEENARVRIADANLFVWEDDPDGAWRVRCLVGRGRPTARGMTIAPVYTPPEWRGRGYASNLVAHVSTLILQEGKDFVTLFTDLANPTSNSIYMRIGFEPRCDFDEWLFEPPG